MDRDRQVGGARLAASARTRGFETRQPLMRLLDLRERYPEGFVHQPEKRQKEKQMSDPNETVPVGGQAAGLQHQVSQVKAQLP